MTNITSALVKELREKTGAGMMDCKKALTEVAGDIEAAIDWLRKKGLSAAANKAGRVAAEGLVGTHTKGPHGVVIEVNAETDFVGRNDIFQQFVKTLGALILDKSIPTLEALQQTLMPHGERTVEQELTHLVAVIGENMSLRRFDHLSVAQGVVASYVHGAVVPGVGRIGVLVALESTAPHEKLEELGRQIAMHIAAAQPLFLSIAEVDAGALARERDVLTEHAKASGRPENVIEKMVEGRLRKYFEEVVLEEQLFVVDGQRKIAQVVADMAKECGAPIHLLAFKRFTLGEGIDKIQTDFAAEVQAQLK